MPTSGRSAAKRMASATADGSSTASLLSSTTHSPLATAIAWLLPRAKPSLRGLRMTRRRSP